METKDNAEIVSSELSEQALSEVAGGGASVPTYSGSGACAGKVDVSDIPVSSTVDQGGPNLLNEAIPPTKSKVVSGLT